MAVPGPRRGESPQKLVRDARSTDMLPMLKRDADPIFRLGVTNDLGRILPVGFKRVDQNGDPLLVLRNLPSCRLGRVLRSVCDRRRRQWGADSAEGTWPVNLLWRNADRGRLEAKRNDRLLYHLRIGEMTRTVRSKVRDRAMTCSDAGEMRLS